VNDDFSHVDPTSLVRPGVGPSGNRYTDKATMLGIIMKRLAQGETLTKITAEAGMPSVWTFFKWLEDDEESLLLYRRAREIQAHVFVDKSIDVANSATDAQLGGLRVKTMHWHASRFNKADFGDTTQVRHADADGKKIDNAPLVNELLGLLETAKGNIEAKDAKSLAKPAQQVLERESSLDASSRAQPGEGLRAAIAGGVDDLV
jgi:hypothetical protein